ncbi:MAG: hypothetical protein V3T23_12900 [Nitrososphaerales archaeon]
MKTQLCGRILLIIIFAVAAVLWAGEPWKDKPWTEWTEKDVKKLLEKSPWVKRGKYTVYEKARNPPVRVPGWSDRDEGKTRARTVHPFTVVWFSALTMREAFVRQRQLQGIPSEDDRDLLSRQPEHYEIMLYGPHARFYCDPPSSAYLRPKRSKQKLSPVRVQLRGLRDRESKQVVWEYRFYFRRNLAGKPTIGPDEKEVEFNCLEGPLNLVTKDYKVYKTVFNLQKMKRAGKPDI